jgi:aminomethyltransferase
MLSYHADADINTNPYELGLDRLVNLEIEANFIGKNALKKIRSKGVKRKQIGLEINCPPLNSPNTTYWPLIVEGKNIGKVTSAIYSPRLKKNIALAMVDIKYSEIGNNLETFIDNKKINCIVVEKPFFDPKKKITSSYI